MQRCRVTKVSGGTVSASGVARQSQTTLGEMTVESHPCAKNAQEWAPGCALYLCRERDGASPVSTGELCIALAHEIAYGGVSGGQRFFIGQENDAEVFCSRALSEAGAVHDRHMLLAN
jgi:hypothetical protein